MPCHPIPPPFQPHLTHTKTPIPPPSHPLPHPHPTPIPTPQAEGMPVKFPGSGGAVVGMCQSEEERDAIKTKYENHGYVFCKLSPHEPTEGLE